MKPALSTFLVASALALGLAAPVAAESSHEPGDAGSLSGEAKVLTRITDSFAEFAGSPENLQSLVSGLRTGSEITLTGGEAAGGTDTSGRVATGKGGTTTTPTPATTTFTPPTGAMGYGGVYTSLALAQAQLSSYGIDSPTPQQIVAALNGGPITSGAGESVTLEGILPMRADGMGWGEIAHAQGTKLGALIGGTRHGDSGSFHATGASGRAAAGKGSGGETHHDIVNAAGGAHGKSSTETHFGRGIHSALGASVAAGAAHAYGQAKHHGLVTASGANAGSAAAGAAIVSAAGGSSAGSAAAGAAIVSAAGVAAAGATSAGAGSGIVSAGGGGPAFGGNGRGHHGHGHAYAYGHGKHGR